MMNRNKDFYLDNRTKNNLSRNRNVNSSQKNPNIYKFNRKADFNLSDNETDKKSVQYEAVVKSKMGDIFTEYRPINKNIKIKKINDINDSNQNQTFATLNMNKSKICYNTIEEKLKLLEDLDGSNVRDLINLGLDRPIVEGTCQDMCPEKERYMRESQNIVSIFERNENNQFDHRRAVKEYERCSIDQKESLHHDLRPTEVLQRTMNYLLLQVVDKEDDKTSWRQWYRFLWDRTRSIRKDITQQNLCNDTVVNIVEIITRFHIFSAAWLCEEIKDDFDASMNDDHLKNCLQTLKDMYADMPADSCINEPEFRSYMIVLNLDKGEMLDEAQKLTSHVFHSPEMTFAISVYQAVSTNNYVRFFRLLEQADLILSCLLHRFIVPMRLRAFEVINKAYVAKGVNQIPLSTILRKLKFENVQEALKFCTIVNQKCFDNMGNLMIILNYANLNFDRKKQLVKKSEMLVDTKKKNQKLSIIFNGGQPVSDNDFDIPDCKMVSFDGDGFYIGSKQLPPIKKTALTETPTLRTPIIGGNEDDEDSEYEVISLTSSDENIFQKEDEEFKSNNSNVTNNRTVIQVNSPFYPPESPGKKNTNLGLSSITKSQNLFSNNQASTTTTSSFFSNISTPISTNQSFFSKIQVPTTTSSLFSNNLTIISTNSLLFSNSPTLISTSQSLFSNIQAPVTTSTLLFNNTITISTNSSLFSNVTSQPHEANQLVAQTNELARKIFSFSNVDSSSNMETNTSPVPVVNKPALSVEDIDLHANDTIDHLISEYVKYQSKIECSVVIESEKWKHLESISIFESLHDDLIRKVVEQIKAIHNRNRKIVFEDIAKWLMFETAREEIQVCVKNYQDKKIEEEKQNIYNQKKLYFKRWNRYSRAMINTRRSLIKLAGTPRLADDFTVCENFRGKVRKISTNWFVSKDVSWNQHPIISRIEKMTLKVSKSAVMKETQSYSTQTMLSYYNKKVMKLNQFIKYFVKTRFIDVINIHLEVVKHASVVDPAPEIIISDYNHIIDELLTVIESKVNKSINVSILKLPNISKISKNDKYEKDFIEKIFATLEMLPGQKKHYIEDAFNNFRLLDPNEDFSDLSYFHIRLFPWISIIETAVLNRVKMIDMKIWDIDIEIETNNFSINPKLQLERIVDEMSVRECIEKSKTSQHINQNQTQNSEQNINPRSMLFISILNKVTKLTQSLNECKENLF